MNAAYKALAEKQAAVCSVFANPTRVLILWALADGERPVSDIAMAVEASLQNTSQHLRLMKERGILKSRREAQTIYYHIVENENTESCQLLLHAYQHMKDAQFS
ncbi:MAG: winged helix-turn-helix transcriptional regulator [Ardenticatenaceae bacterium]|nr:winged helix-turn-helix transcriptional regulator [Ardenticatenaceae bacterium]